MRSVGEIETGHTHPCTQEGLALFHGSRCRSQRTNDLPERAHNMSATDRVEKEGCFGFGFPGGRPEENGVESNVHHRSMLAIASPRWAIFSSNDGTSLDALLRCVGDRGGSGTRSRECRLEDGEGAVPRCLAYLRSGRQTASRCVSGAQGASRCRESALSCHPLSAFPATKETKTERDAHRESVMSHNLSQRSHPCCRKSKSCVRNGNQSHWFQKTPNQTEIQSPSSKGLSTASCIRDVTCERTVAWIVML